MTREELIKELEDLFETEEGVLTEKTILEDLDEWDSLSKLSLLTFAKMKFSIMLSPDQIKNLETVADICDLLF